MENVRKKFEKIFEKQLEKKLENKLESSQKKSSIMEIQNIDAVLLYAKYLFGIIGFNW